MQWRRYYLVFSRPAKYWAERSFCVCSSSVITGGRGSMARTATNHVSGPSHLPSELSACVLVTGPNGEGEGLLSWCFGAPVVLTVPVTLLVMLLLCTIITWRPKNRIWSACKTRWETNLFQADFLQGNLYIFCRKPGDISALLSSGATWKKRGIKLKFVMHFYPNIAKYIFPRKPYVSCVPVLKWQAPASVKGMLGFCSSKVMLSVYPSIAISFFSSHKRAWKSPSGILLASYGSLKGQRKVTEGKDG